MMPCSQLYSTLTLSTFQVTRTPPPFSSNPKSSIHTITTAFLSFPPPSRHFLCRSSLDPNAEFRSQEESSGGDRRRRWWFDRNTDEEFGPSDDEEEEDEDDGEQLWDRIWIFKVFKAYGYMLPAIIASMLLATGPKAFLLALAVPLGQSVISLAVDKLWGLGQEEQTIGPRSRRKPSSKYPTNFRNRKQDESNNESGRREESPPRSVANADSNDSNTTGLGRQNFGGWDELDRNGEQAKWRRSRSERPSRSHGVKMRKLSKEGRYGGAPLFLRLLIAVFPFLGSWIRIL